ncbi:conserved hypothetical protein [Rhodopseudomonas palustris HaA2]|uniref:DNA-binding protein n=1 Tax=Rhodopseudomonas palustris (strain HaA2) TaxID=316058 RepID=Q2ITR7_RHOP2|nr:hypothetical protein [Rhodopseudomonas palustris]ABD08393.1 conserved hypothetical protein [Rhodopseudomonas palustris HaA2]
MKTFEFRVIASGLDPDAEDFADRFFQAGCDDATISFQRGRIVLDFDRSARSIGEAIASAMESVRKAGATVERIEPDPLVSLSDIAARTGLTRAAMTQYSKRQRGKNFPPPIARVTSDSPLWDWAIVAKWLYANNKLSREAAIEAEAVRLANTAVTSRDSQFRESLESSVQAYARSLEAA